MSAPFGHTCTLAWPVHCLTLMLCRTQMLAHDLCKNGGSASGFTEGHSCKFHLCSIAAEAWTSKKRPVTCTVRPCTGARAPTYIANGVQKELGWSRAALEAGCRDQGLSPAAVGMLPSGPAELVQVGPSPLQPLDLDDPAAAAISSIPFDWVGGRRVHHERLSSSLGHQHAPVACEALKVALVRSMAASVDDLVIAIALSPSVWHGRVVANLSFQAIGRKVTC